MSNFTYVVTDEVGIHGRPAGVLVKKCSEFKSNINIACKGKSADAKRIMGVMSLGAKKGDTVYVDNFINLEKLDSVLLTLPLIKEEKEMIKVVGK